MRGFIEINAYFHIVTIREFVSKCHLVLQILHVSKNATLAIKQKYCLCLEHLFGTLYIFIYDAYEDIIDLFIESFSYNNYDEIMLIHFVV